MQFQQDGPKDKKYSSFILSRPGGTLCPLTKITAYLQNGLELLFCDFCLYVFSIKKSSVPPISRHVCSHGNHAISGLFLRTRIAIVFQVFPPERNLLWDNLLCFGHPITLRSLIEANIRTGTMETFQKIILPKYGHQHQNN